MCREQAARLIVHSKKRERPRGQNTRAFSKQVFWEKPVTVKRLELVGWLVGWLVGQRKKGSTEHIEAVCGEGRPVNNKILKAMVLAGRKRGDNPELGIEKYFS
jgi:hypothetical protein